MMKAYQPTVLNTLAPYAGPQGFGMNKMTGQTIDQQTTVASNQIDPTPFRNYSVPTPALAYYGLSESAYRRALRRVDTRNMSAPIINPQNIRPMTARPMAPVVVTATDTAPAATVVEPIVITPAPAKPWYKSPLYITLLAAGAFLVAKKFKIV